MACCLLCFSSESVPDNPKSNRPETFQISMLEGAVKNQPVCCLTYLCTPCCVYYTRYSVLDGDMTRYECCQGYMDVMCFTAGSFSESSCPEFCLAVESCCCIGPSMSSSRMYAMDRWDIRPDACDNRLIRFNNCIQCLSCVCDILAIFLEDLRDCAKALDCIASALFYSMIGCMAAQVLREVKFRASSNIQLKQEISY